MVEHPITPPPELVQQWISTRPKTEYLHIYIATQAASWGDGQRLEACCEWLREARHHGLGYEVGAMLADRLRAAMRPKPSSAAEQAETALLHLIHAAAPQMDTNEPAHYIRTALKRLQQLELESHD